MGRRCGTLTVRLSLWLCPNSGHTSHFQQRATSRGGSKPCRVFSRNPAAGCRLTPSAWRVGALATRANESREVTTMFCFERAWGACTNAAVFEIGRILSYLGRRYIIIVGVPPMSVAPRLVGSRTSRAGEFAGCVGMTSNQRSKKRNTHRMTNSETTISKVDSPTSDTGAFQRSRLMSSCFAAGWRLSLRLP